MPIVTLRYNLPDEQSDFNMANNGSAYHSILWELDQWLRTQVKHNNRNELQDARDKLTELMQDGGVDFEP